MYNSAGRATRIGIIGIISTRDAFYAGNALTLNRIPDKKTNIVIASNKDLDTNNDTYAKPISTFLLNIEKMITAYIHFNFTLIPLFLGFLF